MPKSKWTKVEILNSVVAQIDLLVKEKLFPSRQNATNYLIRKGLERYEHPLLYDDFFVKAIERLDKIEADLHLLLKDREEGENKK